MSYFNRSSRRQRVLLIAFGLFAGLAAGEVLFRIVPFERIMYERRYGHFRRNQVACFHEYDPVLPFRNRRSTSFPGDGVEINSLGIRGPEIHDPKPPGLWRVICLGDSCTFGPAHPYPQVLQSMLDERAPGAFEIINAGVIGYTSLHGLKWLERDLARLHPDVVTLYFGWNDMWREKDSAVRAWFRGRIAGEPRTWLHSYLWEAASRGIVFLANGVGTSELQVPPAQYRAILEKFATLGRERGFTVLYLTAPAGFDEDQATPQWLI